MLVITVFVMYMINMFYLLLCCLCFFSIDFNRRYIYSHSKAKKHLKNAMHFSHVNKSSLCIIEVK